MLFLRALPIARPVPSPNCPLTPVCKLTSGTRPRDARSLLRRDSRSRTGVENSAIRKCSALYYHVDHAQEVHDIDSDWPVGVTWLVTDFGGGVRGRSPRGGDPRAHAAGGARAPRRARAARAPPPTVNFVKTEEVGHFVKQNGRRDVAVT